MPRIAKSDVHAALQRAAQHIQDAAGPDGRVSRADIKAKVASLEGTEKNLVDIFFRFIDHRDHVPGAQVTKKDIDRAVDYAKEKLIDQYDVNNNGLSNSEISEMSRTGQLAVQLAKEMRMAATIAIIETPEPDVRALYGIRPIDPDIVAEYAVQPPPEDPPIRLMYGIMPEEPPVDLDPPMVTMYGIRPTDPPVVAKYGIAPAPTDQKDPTDQTEPAPEPPIVAMYGVRPAFDE
jgi:hypothetical protein